MTESSMPSEPPTRVCSNCGTQSQSDGGFCSHCGASFTQSRRGPGRNAIIAAVVVPILIIGAGTGIALKVAADKDSPASDQTRSFSVDEAHLSFDLPSDWEEFDRDKMQEAFSDSAEMDELTDRMGVSNEQFRQMMASNIVLFVTAPHAEAGFLSNVNVIVSDGKLPTVGTVELQYRALGAIDIDSEEWRTDMGDGHSTTYTLGMNGNEVHGAAILLRPHDKTVVITVSSHDASETDRLADEIRNSLADSP
jgi:predicted nucleic acid-binding Zn ribbon protein